MRALKINLSLSLLLSHLCMVRSAIMLKRIYRSTPPEVIVEVLEPYVRLTTANVRIIKNRTGPMGHTYGFIDLDSHAVSFLCFGIAKGQLAIESLRIFEGLPYRWNTHVLSGITTPLVLSFGFNAHSDEGTILLKLEFLSVFPNLVLFYGIYNVQLK